MKKESKEVDLYVSPKKLTEKDMQELRDFIKEYKKQQSLKKKKHRKAA